MKKAFKIFAMMLLASAVMFTACTKDDNDSNNTNTNQSGGNGGGDNPQPQPQPQPEPQPQEPNYTITFDGQPLDVAGYSTFQCGEYQHEEQSYFLWRGLVAQGSDEEGISLPLVEFYLMGSTAQECQAASVELFYEYIFQDNEQNQFGDWQLYETTSFNCTAMDMTAHTLSFTGAFTMFSLADIADQVVESPDDATKKDLVLTVSNITFEYAGNPAKNVRAKKAGVDTKANLRKMNILK